ncbi:SDR family oxidoreductase [Massilia glaciei]|uniref:SDR family oxidoreductase n=1 Tax=Massilia glaciei TaxID=1524097 RepID=UPI00268A78E4|nr:SDR family oxidoreductase [Massilia glaciei]
MKAVLTGHTRGLGAAIAEELLGRGIAVLGLARRHNTELGARFPATLAQVELDLTDSAELARWLAGPALAHFLEGAETVLLINNAGMVKPVGPLGRLDIAQIGAAISLNVAAPLMLSSAFVGASGAAADRRIVHVSSGAGRGAYAGWGGYCAGKAALDHHARSVALDRTHGLRICSLAPGVIDTDMQANLRACSLEQFPDREKFDRLKREGALSAPAEGALRLVDYLLSDKFGREAVADLRG